MNGHTVAKRKMGIAYKIEQPMEIVHIHEDSVQLLQARYAKGDPGVIEKGN